MVDWPNATAPSRWELDLKPEDLQKSTCVLGFIPVIYYSVLLCVGVPGESRMAPPCGTQRPQANATKPAYLACC